MRHLLGNIALVAGAVLAVFMLIQRWLDRAPGQSVTSALWAPVKPQGRFYLGLTLMWAGMWLTTGRLH